MKRLIEWWNRYWFPCTSRVNLAGARILVVAAQLFWFFPDLTHHINLALKNSAFIDPQPVIRAILAVAPREAVFNPIALTILYWVTFAAGLLALVGLFTRLSLLVLALGIWVFVSHSYSYADVHHPQALFAILLMVLPLAPAGASLSLDALLRRRRARQAAAVAVAPRHTETAMWPLKLAHVLLAMTYFSTGITKLLSGGLAWMNGYTLQNYIFINALNRDIPLGLWLSQQYTLCVVLAVLTVLFECFYFVSILVPRAAPLIFLGAIFFHYSLYATSGHPFFQHIVMNTMLLLFLNPEWFPGRLNAFASAISRARAAAEAQQAS